MPILIPTKGRPQNIERFASMYKLTKATEPVVLLLDGDDRYLADYFNNQRASNFWCWVAPDSDNGIGGIMNEYFRRFPDEEYYAILADDVVPQTEHWDIILKQACLESRGLAWGDDGLQGAGLPTHPFICGDVVRALGYIAHPKLKHCYIDDCWLAIANVIGGQYMPNIKLTHFHHLNGKAQLDETYLSQPPIQDDASAFREIQQPYLLELLTAKEKLKNESISYRNN